MGPSASAVQPADVSADKMTQLLKLLTGLQEMVKDPSVQGMMGELSSQFPILGSGGGHEVDAARAGAPSSSKPGAAAVKPAPEKSSSRKPTPEICAKDRNVHVDNTVDKTKPGKDAPEVKTEELEDEDHRSDAGDCGEEKEVNSSTHRKEHARLSRRMASIDAAQYPEMVRLWNGSRKDCGGSNCVLTTFFPPLTFFSYL